MRLSVVIPAYNEVENIESIIHDILESIRQSEELITDHEIIIVDDASSDGMFEVVVAADIEKVSIIRLSRRSGSHIAVRAGLDNVSGDAVLCIAADGQDDPRAINRMVKKWVSGCRIVWALRKERSNEGIIASFFARFFYYLLNLFGEIRSKIDLSRADFYLLDREVVNAIISCRETNTSLFGLIVWLGYRQCSIEYERQPRKAGISKWTFRSKIQLAKDWIIAFSGIPLKIMTLVGFIVAGVGFAYAILIIAKSVFWGSPVQGWSSVMTAILLLGGGQMIMLGVVGEYLWRTLDESRNRPHYFIEKCFPDSNKYFSR
jgi:dolichol-phosphate mannosyltransferase